MEVFINEILGYTRFPTSSWGRGVRNRLGRSNSHNGTVDAGDEEIEAGVLGYAGDRGGTC
jgi:hypothetical protein